MGFLVVVFVVVVVIVIIIIIIIIKTAIKQCFSPPGQHINKQRGTT